MTSKLEINIRSLIVHCEELAKSDPKNWLLKKYIKSLDTMIKELESQRSDDTPKTTVIDEYRTRCMSLKSLTNYVEPTQVDNKLKLKSRVAGGSDHVMKEIGQIQDSKYTNSLRRDLLGMKSNDPSGLRKRGTSNANEDMNQAMKHHADLQEQIAEDMLALTRNLKEQTETANKIIRRDTDVVGKSSKLSEMNYSALNNEAATLKEHSRRAWKCWMWIIIGLVMIIFMFMVLFMKIMKKRTS